MQATTLLTLFLLGLTHAEQNWNDNGNCIAAATANGTPLKVRINVVEEEAPSEPQCGCSVGKSMMMGGGQEIPVIGTIPMEIIRGDQQPKMGMCPQPMPQNFPQQPPPFQMPSQPACQQDECNRAFWITRKSKIGDQGAPQQQVFAPVAQAAVGKAVAPAFTSPGIFAGGAGVPFAGAGVIPGTVPVVAATPFLPPPIVPEVPIPPPIFPEIPISPPIPPIGGFECWGRKCRRGRRHHHRHHRHHHHHRRHGSDWSSWDGPDGFGWDGFDGGFGFGGFGWDGGFPGVPGPFFLEKQASFGQPTDTACSPAKMNQVAPASEQSSEL